MIRKSLLLTPLLAATAHASDFSYTQLDVGYLNGNAELPNGSLFGAIDNDLDIEGFAIGGRFEVTNNFFVYGNYEDGEIEPDALAGAFDIDIWRLEAGIGSYFEIADNADVYFSVGYKHSELDAGFTQSVGNVDLLLGLRWAPASWIEFNAYVEHSIGVHDDDFLEAVDVTSAGLNIYVTACQYVQPFVGVSVELDSSDDNLVGDLTLYSAGLRFSF
jgi:hypothetical protein